MTRISGAKKKKSSKCDVKTLAMPNLVVKGKQVKSLLDMGKLQNCSCINCFYPG